MNIPWATPSRTACATPWTPAISSGMPITMRVAIKPTASISQPQQTVNMSNMTNDTLVIQGRHDPCIVARAVPCVEAAVNIALLSHMLDYPHFVE